MNRSAEKWEEVPCPLCGSDQRRLYVRAPSHYGPEKLRVTKCLDCGMIFTNPQLVRYEEKVERRGALDPHFNSERLRMARQKAQLRLSILSQHSVGRSVLDFGAGAGAFTRLAVDEGWDAVGLDLNRGLVEAANSHWGFDAIVAGHLDQFAASNKGSFDAVMANQVLEHIQKPVDLGRTLVSLLKPSGVIYIDVPHVHCPAEWFNRGKTLDPTAHCNHFSTRTLRQLVRDIGCRTVYSSAAPGLVGLYQRLGLGKFSLALGRLTKKVFLPLGSGVCVIGRKRGP